MIRFEEVRDIIADQLDIPAYEVTKDASFEALGADSMDLSYLVIDLEELAGIEIPDDKFNRFFTVGDVFDYLNDPRSDPS